MTGQTISHYRIADKLGEGGMGVVYKAEDLNLHRPVALKFLRADAVGDHQLHGRFWKEAEAAAALDHPNITTVYEIAEADGQTFIAMALIEGESLAAKIKRRPLPIEEALSIASQVAEALQAAHERGIVHRDIKPGNIMITPKGQVKVMDFGLAHLAGQTRITKTGAVMGTPAYMSPEQADGQSLDLRTDIWSLGCVLYEMITGQLPFRGDSDPALLRAILDDQPEPMTAIRVGTPPELDRIVTKALGKDPAQRYQTCADFRVDLRSIQETKHQPAQKPQPVGSSRLRQIVTAGAIFAAGALATWALLTLAPSGPPEMPDFQLVRLTADDGRTVEPDISPDGRLIAYASDRAGDGGLDIWVQQLGGGGAIRRTFHAGDDQAPEFSSDGESILFGSGRDGGGLYVMNALAGEPRLLVPVNSSRRTARYSPDGTAVAYSVTQQGVTVISSSGGNERPVPQLWDGAVWFGRPIWLNSERLLYYSLSATMSLTSDDESEDWWVTSIDGGDASPTGVYPRLRKAGLLGDEVGVDAGDWSAKWQRVIFSARRGNSWDLWAAPLSLRTSRIVGTLTHLTASPGSPSRPRVSSDGQIVFENRTEAVDIWRFPLSSDGLRTEGSPERVTTGPSTNTPRSIAANGKTLAYNSDRYGATGLWTMDLLSGEHKLIVETSANGLISPNGSTIAYRKPGERLINLRPIQGGPSREICGGTVGLYSWSPDSRFVLTKQGPRVFQLCDTETGEVSTLTRHPTSPIHEGHFSPDGKWIVFHSVDEPGLRRVYMAPVNVGAETSMEDWVLLADGDSQYAQPDWSDDGRLVYYLSTEDGDWCLYVQPVDSATKTPHGPAQLIQHFHEQRVDQSSKILVTGNSLVIELGETKSNVWMLDPIEDTAP